MKRTAIILTLGLSLLSACGKDAEPRQTAVCQGHGSVVRQESANDYRSPGFTGKAYCSDGRTEFWIDGVLDEAF
jgi:hypothetical protein